MLWYLEFHFRTSPSMQTKGSLARQQDNEGYFPASDHRSLHSQETQPASPLIQHITQHKHPRCSIKPTVIVSPLTNPIMCSRLPTRHECTSRIGLSASHASALTAAPYPDRQPQRPREVPDIRLPVHSNTSRTPSKPLGEEGRVTPTCTPEIRVRRPDTVQ